MLSGFSTSACAAAAAAAATEVLLTGRPMKEVTINLPARRAVGFKLVRCDQGPDRALCGIIKGTRDNCDGANNGLEIQALVEYAAEAGILLHGGAGVGVATLPGLPVPVGEAAIHPGPRRLIQHVIQETWTSLNFKAAPNLSVTVQVPEGERIAAQTMNPKLGIAGGIPILGTDGPARAPTAPAFRADIFYKLNAARKAGYTTVGLTAGKRGTAYLQAYLQDERGLGVVDAGDELSYPLRQAGKFGFEQVTLGGMLGWFSKLAQGRWQTRTGESEVDFDFLAELAADLGASGEICERVRTARTARQAQGWLQKAGLQLEPDLARHAAQQAYEASGGLLVEALIFSPGGEVLGQGGMDLPRGAGG